MINRLGAQDYTVNCRQFLIKKGRQLFLLLLPLAFIEEEEIQSVREKIAEQMRNYFLEDLCENVSGCIVAALTQ